jgi:phosphatidylglycerophosphatase A
MKQAVIKRKPTGVVDRLALAITTFGVGYIPGAPGTYGSIVAVGVYLGIGSFQTQAASHGPAFTAVFHYALNAVLLAAFILIGIWASGRAIPLLGNSDASEAVVDEVVGQLVTFAFIPFGLGWPFILAGFLLFRLFDIWKPYPVNLLQDLPGGLGICADDIVAGVYAGICLAVAHAVYLSI